jgi:hypothetical protein
MTRDLSHPVDVLAARYNPCVTRRSEPASLAVRNDEPLIGVLTTEDGEEVVRYFVDAEDASEALPEASRRDALELAGAWRDLDWDEMAAALDRIRHASPPSAPLSL